MCVWVHWSIRFPRYIKFHHTTIGFPYQHVHSLGVALFFGQETAAEKEKKKAPKTRWMERPKRGNERWVSNQLLRTRIWIRIQILFYALSYSADFISSFGCFYGGNPLFEARFSALFFVIVMMTNHLRTESGESSERPRKKEVNFRLNGGLSHGELMANPSGLKAA